MRIPIRYQFLLPLVVVALASLLAVGAIHARQTTRQTQEQIGQRLRGVVTVLSESSYPLTDTVLRQMGGLAGAMFVLTNSDGELLASSGPLAWAPLPADHLTANTAEEVTLGQEQIVGDTHYLHSSVWVRRRWQFQQPAVLHILFSRRDFDAAWRAAFVPPLVVGAVTIAVVTLVTFLVARGLSSTLRRLGKEVDRLADGDFSEVALPERNDETRDLALAVNQTASRLADYESELRRTERLQTVAMLGAGLAHEMRNAATGCRLALDLHAEDCPAAANDDSLDVARRQLVLMESRLRQLLQAGKDAPPAEESLVHLADLVSQCVALVQPAARHAGVQLDWETPEEGLTVLADPELLTQAVMNILTNALDAATKGRTERQEGRVVVEMDRRGEDVELLVSDSGDGPSQQLNGDAFEPFVTSKPEGVGLGLAVARRVIDTSGGQIDWRREEGLTKFRIHLPLANREVVHV